MGSVTRIDTYRTAAIVTHEDRLQLYDHIDVYKGFCPACNRALRQTAFQQKSMTERFCVGGRRWFLWLRKCRETRPHMHQSCSLCGAKWVCAPAENAAFG